MKTTSQRRATLPKRPTCATCGRPLPNFENHLNMRRVYRVDEEGATQLRGKPSPDMTATGQAPTHGYYGDNVFCGLMCGWLMAVRLCRSIGVPDVFRLLPSDLDPAIFAARETEKRRIKAREQRQRKKQQAPGIKVPLLFPGDEL